LPTAQKQLKRKLSVVLTFENNTYCQALKHQTKDILERKTLIFRKFETYNC
jgi:uncharacterized protein (UPF0303 family)